MTKNVKKVGFLVIFRTSKIGFLIFFVSNRNRRFSNISKGSPDHKKNKLEFSTSKKNISKKMEKPFPLFGLKNAIFSTVLKNSKKREKKQGQKTQCDWQKRDFWKSNFGGDCRRRSGLVQKSEKTGFLTHFFAGPFFPL